MEAEPLELGVCALLMLVSVSCTQGMTSGRHYCPQTTNTMPFKHTKGAVGRAQLYVHTHTHTPGKTLTSVGIRREAASHTWRAEPGGMAAVMPGWWAASSTDDSCICNSVLQHKQFTKGGMK
eukprot:1161141-Pelagomonas_calceolata.AAC.3